jgi:hypothetical protein
MTVTLNRPYAGNASGSVVTFDAKTESALVTQGLASTALSTATTTGAQTTNATQGLAAIAAGSSSVVITDALINANTFVTAYVAQATADTTLLRVERIVPAAGSVTIFGTANATATTLIRWAIVPTVGLLPTLGTI